MDAKVKVRAKANAKSIAKATTAKKPVRDDIKAHAAKTAASMNLPGQTTEQAVATA